MFTRDQAIEMANLIAEISGVKDTHLPESILPLDGSELLAIVQNGTNKRLKLSEITGGGGVTRKARFALQLPIGSYVMKLLYSKNNPLLIEARRIQAWYRLDVNGVKGTPINQFNAGVDTLNRQAWTREILFEVADTTSAGNVVLNMWSTANDQDSGLNFIEITQLS